MATPSSTPVSENSEDARAFLQARVACYAANDGVFYYAMELVDGANLQRIVAVGGAQAPGRVVRILTMVCGALSEAHAIGLIQRDIKPANIMLCTQGGERDVVKVLDFGLVKASRDREGRVGRG